jgi:hypothetical protein
MTHGEKRRKKILHGLSPPLVGEVSANFCCHVVSVTDPYEEKKAGGGKSEIATRKCLNKVGRKDTRTKCDKRKRNDAGNGAKKERKPENTKI